MTTTKTPFAAVARVQFVLRIWGAQSSAISRPAYQPRREAPRLLAWAIIAPSSVEIHRASINGFAGEPTLASPSESIIPDSFTFAHRVSIISAAARHNVPAVYPYSDFARDGGLLSYAVDPVDTFRRAATYVDRILRGAKPSDLPVQQPTKFELVINLKTAKALGLTIPETLLATADEVIQ